MRLLIDTCVLIWAVGDTKRLSQRARSLLQDEANDIFVSAISAYEILQRYHLKGDTWMQPVATDFKGEVEAAGFEVLELSVDHIMAAGNLPWAHRDPFDRMIVAQAMVEGIPLITSDETVLQLTSNVIWK